MADPTIPKTTVDTSRFHLDGTKHEPVDIKKLFEELRLFERSPPEVEAWGRAKLGPVEDVEGKPGLKEQRFETLPFAPDVQMRLRFREGDETRRILIETKVNRPSVDDDGIKKALKVDIRTDPVVSKDIEYLIDKLMGRLK